MTFRITVLPLGFGLSALLSVPAGAGDHEAAPAAPRPVRVYTNADLERVRPFRDEMGARSVPAVPARPDTAETPREARGRGEAYWRREAARVRERVRALTERAEDLRARIADDAEEARQLTRRGRRSAPSAETRLRMRLSALERRSRQLEEDLAERARREGALPGWLR